MSRPLGSFLKENAVLIAGVALPLMLVILFTVARALPTKNVPDPQYKAVYALQPYYGSFNYTFKIKDDGKLDVTLNIPANPNNYVDNTTQKTQLVIFDGANNKTQTIDVDMPAHDKEQKSVPIAVKEFDNLTLASGDAPDGYKFRDESYSGSSLLTELFTYRSRHIPRAIVKDGREIPLSPQTYGNFVFIGWVTKE